MVDRLIFGLVVLSLIALIPVAYKLAKALWDVRDMRGIAVAIFIVLVISYVWMIAFLGTLMVNRFFDLGPMNDYFLVALGVVLLAQPIGLGLYIWRWERGITKEKH